ASTARTKNKVISSIVDKHAGEPTLVIGAYLDQLEELGAELDAPVVQGSTRNKEREALFDAFRRGEIDKLVVSKVANFSIDLPEASVAIQVSGTFGSRQEEAQRLGRLLRPKSDGRQAHFYSVVARDTVDTEYAAHRQRFLAEQGYAYHIVDADDLLRPLCTGKAGVRDEVGPQLTRSRGFRSPPGNRRWHSPGTSPTMDGSDHRRRERVHPRTTRPRGSRGDGVIPHARSEVRVGTSGWVYANWRGVFYPKDLRRGHEL